MGSRKPNILFMIADDHRHDAIRAAGDSVVQTPVLDVLAERGVMLGGTHSNGGVVGAVCIPSRACVNTGTHVFQATASQHIDDYPGAQTLNPELLTLPLAFRRSGYQTHAIGKWHNDKTSFTRGFAGGDCLFFGGMSEHTRVPVFDYDPTGAYPPEAQRTETQFSTELFTDAAVNFIRGYNREEPFFLYLAYTSPHDPRSAPEAFAHLYDPKQVPLPPNYLDVHPFDNGEMAIRDEVLAARPRGTKEIRRHIADYYAMITHMDQEIGRVLKALEASGRLEHTIIVYTADHGLAVGQHGLMGKQNMYDHSIRVPWIMRGPGLPEGRRIEALTYQYDIFPTLCELADLPAPVQVGGRSMLPLIRGERREGRETVYSLYKDIQRMVKNDRWKLIVYRRSAITGNGSNLLQLFDLHSDPWEKRNLAFDPKYKVELEHLRQKLAEEMAAAGDPLLEVFSKENG